MASSPSAHRISFEAHPGVDLAVQYYVNVGNAGALAELIRGGGVPEHTAIIDGSLVPDVDAVAAAADMALRAKGCGRVATRTMGSELVFCLSGSKHISEALRRFGIANPDCTQVVVAWFEAKGTGMDMGDAAEAESFVAKVQGERSDLANLAANADLKRIKKYYKIQEQELAVGTLVDSVVFRIGAKEYL